MDYLIFMHVVECFAYLLDYIFGHILRNFTLLLQKIIELTRKAKLQCQIYKIFISKKCIHFYDISIV